MLNPHRVPRGRCCSCPSLTETLSAVSRVTRLGWAEAGLHLGGMASAGTLPSPFELADWLHKSTISPAAQGQGRVWKEGLERIP